MSKATGDLYNTLIKLKKSLKTIKYTNIDNDELTIGSPKEYLKLYHYLMIDYNPQIAIDILNKYQIEFNNKNDKTFIDLIYKLMRDWLNYKPSLTKEQFFTTGFAELKALMTRDLIDLIYKKYKFNNGTATAATANVYRSHSALSGKPVAFTNENYKDQIKSALLKPISATTAATATTNKTPLIHNHRILNNHNLNLAVNVHHQPQPPSTHKHINEEKHQPSARKENLLEILTKDDSAITYNDSMMSSRDGDTQIMKSFSSSSVTLMGNNNNHLNDELNSKLDRVTNRIESLETYIKNSNSNTTNQRDDDQVVQKSMSTITISLKDYENLIARLSLLETKVLMLEQEQSLLKKQNTTNMNGYSTSVVSSAQPLNSIFNKNTQQQPVNVEGLNKKRMSVNTDVAQTLTSQPQPTTPTNDDYDEEATLYETPFVSFMMNKSNSNEDLRLSRGAGSIGGIVNMGHTTPNPNSITKALLAQGILTTTDTSVNEHDLSISQHDLTPTIEDPTNGNDILHRARSLLNKASNLNEELKVKL